MSRAIKKIPYKFVHVYWIDIVSDSSWRSVEDVKESSLPRCLSTGFLIDDDDEMIRIVSDFNFNDDGSNNEVNIFDFSGDLNFGIQKIKEIKNTFPSFNFCSILTLPSGSNSEMIDGLSKKVSEIRPMIAVTKLEV